MNMIEPTQSEKDKAIENILDKGLRKPRSIWSMFSEIHSLFSFRFIFWDTAQAFILSVLTLVSVSVVIMFSPEAFRHTVLFGGSPLLFMAILFFSEAFEYTNSLYELKMTCKFTIRQITAFRIMCYALLGIVFCVGITAYQAENAYELPRLFPLSLCALFLCAFISLFLIRRIAGKLTIALTSILWLTVVSIPAWVLNDKWERFLAGLPVAVTVGVAVLSGALFLFEVKKLMNTRKTEVVGYVIG
jgi:hypothetical protein